MIRSILRRFFGTKSTVAPTAATSRAFANPPVASRPAPPSTAAPANDGGVVSQPLSADVLRWTPRDIRYWQQRRDHVLARLASEWAETGDAAKWPDVQGLLDLLAEDPANVIRQLPTAARDAMAVCDNEALSRSQLSTTLGTDPSLVQGLLRQANSIFYGAGLQPVLRVDTAIDRIGIAGTRAVVLASCIDGLLSKPGGHYDTMVASVWTHMVNTAPWARPLATVFGTDPEEAFAVALLHDVGKLVIFDRISSLRTSRRRAIALPDAFVSMALARLHEPLGALAAHLWGLGPAAADAIGLHHRRERPAMQHPLAEVLHVAERTEHAVRMNVPLDFDGVWRLGALSADPERCRELLDQHLRAA